MGVGAWNEERKINKNTTKKRRLLFRKYMPIREKIIQCAYACVCTTSVQHIQCTIWFLHSAWMFTKLCFTTFNNFHRIFQLQCEFPRHFSKPLSHFICWLMSMILLLLLVGFSSLILAELEWPWHRSHINICLYWNRNWYWIVLKDVIKKSKYKYESKWNHNCTHHTHTHTIKYQNRTNCYQF